MRSRRAKTTRIGAPSRTATRLGTLGLVLGTALVIAGCGTTTIDTQKAESVLKQEVITQTGVNVTSVSCPANITAKMGATFTCVAHGADGTHAPINVIQKDNQGNVNFNTSLVNQKVVETGVKEYVESKDEGVSGLAVKCPDVLPFEVGHKFTCELSSSNGESAKAVVTMNDTKGGFSFEITH